MLNKFVYRLITYAISVCIIYIICVNLAGHFLPGFINKNLKFKQGLTGFMHSRLIDADAISNSIDILFIGSSHAYRGFDTRYFLENGFSSFNLGSSNQTPKQSELLLKHYLPALKPRLVVFEVFPETFEMDGVESSVDIISNSNNQFLAFKEAYQQNHIISWNTLLFRLGFNLFNPTFHEDTLTQEDHYIVGQGFVESLSHSVKFQDNIESKFWNLRDDQLASFVGIIKLLKNLNINFVLVQAPTTKKYYTSYLNNAIIDSKFSQYGYYYNFNKINLNLTDSIDFYDSNHLNQKGVLKFNSGLIKLIKDIVQPQQ